MAYLDLMRQRQQRRPQQSQAQGAAGGGGGGGAAPPPPRTGAGVTQPLQQQAGTQGAAPARKGPAPQVGGAQAQAAPGPKGRPNFGRPQGQGAPAPAPNNPFQNIMQSAGGGGNKVNVNDVAADDYDAPDAATSDDRQNWWEGQWGNLLEQQQGSFDQSMQLAAANQAMNQRRAAEMGAMGGQAVGSGAFQGAQAQAGLQGSMERARMSQEHQRESINLRKQWLDQLSQQAESAQDRELQAWIQEQQDATDLAMAELEFGDMPDAEGDQGANSQATQAAAEALNTSYEHARSGGTLQPVAGGTFQPTQNQRKLNSYPFRDGNVDVYYDAGAGNYVYVLTNPNGGQYQWTDSGQ